jgi:hypothetical protein
MPYRREIDRGVVTLQAQVRELAADLSELKGETRTWQNTHDRAHEQEARDRTAGRRWLVGTAIAALVALCTVVGLLISLIAELHHHA